MVKLCVVCVCVYVCVCVSVCVCVLCVMTDGETPGCVRSLVCFPARNGSHVSTSCKRFSLQRAPHAGVFEAAAFFFDAYEESVGPARDAPLHRVLIHLGPRGADSGFHLHFVLGVACEALLQHFVDLVLPSRPDLVVERIKIWRICRESQREQCRCGRQVRCITAPISCHGGAVPGRTRLLAWRNPCQSALSPSGCSNEPRARGIQAMPFSQWKARNAASRHHRPMWHQQQPWCLSWICHLREPPCLASSLALKRL